MKKMKLNNIGTRPFFYPIHKQPVFRKLGYFKDDIHPNSEFIYKQGLYLPSGINLNFKEIDRVVKVISELCNLENNIMLKIAVIFDQKLYSGGGYKQSINMLNLLEKIS